MDRDWRLGCTAGHGAAHLVLTALTERFGSDNFITTGCRITPGQSRLDLQSSSLKFGGQILIDLQNRVNEWVDQDLPVTITPVDAVPEMFMWDVELLSPHARMPCGGTHYRGTRAIGHVRLKRRREGKNLERIYIYSADTEGVEAS